MKKALIIVQNENNRTRKLGEVITAFLLRRGLAAELIPINNFEPRYLNDADYLLLGSWESKSLFPGKHPDKEWESFLKRLPTLDGIKTALFTANKFSSGGVLKSMKKYLTEKTGNLEYALKSKNGSLTISDQLLLNEFIK